MRTDREPGSSRLTSNLETRSAGRHSRCAGLFLALPIAVFMSLTGVMPARAQLCPGDCNADGVVTIDELITAVGIALEERAADACTASDIDSNGRVSVDELVRAVGSALNGCALSSQTPTPTPSIGVPTSTPTSPVSTGSHWLTAYYPSYQQFLVPPSEVDYTAVSHLIHWPVLPRTDGSLDTASTDFSEEHSADVVARAHAAGTKVLLGIGGDATSGATAGFQGATGDGNRARFVANIVTLMRDRGYDGVDINWEEIGSDDEERFTAFIGELRAALDQLTPRPLLTMPPETGAAAHPALIASVQQHLDQINLQTYVMSGAYPGWVTWFNSPLYNGGFEFPSVPGARVPSVDDEVDRFVAAGIPAARLAIGIQFDGFVWAGGSGTDTGGVTKPRQEWDRSASRPDGTDVGAPDVTVERYADIVDSFGAAQGFTKTFDVVARVPYLSRDSAADVDDRFISFDDEQAISEKGQYAKSKGLGGVFIFELTGDYFGNRPAAERHPLLSAAKTAIKAGFVDGP